MVPELEGGGAATWASLFHFPQRLFLLIWAHEAKVGLLQILHPLSQCFWLRFCVRACIDSHTEVSPLLSGDSWADGRDSQAPRAGSVRIGRDKGRLSKLRTLEMPS